MLDFIWNCKPSSLIYNMETKFSIREVLTNFPISLFTYKEAVQFIQTNKLWRGMDQYGWLSKALVIVAIILAWYAYGTVGRITEVFDAQDFTAAYQSLSSSVSDISSMGADFVSSSYFKYIVFILMEVVIFHFARRTLEIKTNQNFDTTFKAFWKAEKRMLKVAIHCAVTEWFLTLAITIIVSIFGLDFIKAPLVLIMQCYFLGFLMLDNYNEAYHLTIKESLKFSKSFSGVALGIGFVSYMMMMIPLVGSFLAPLLGAVTAAIVMHRLIPEGPTSPNHLAKLAKQMEAAQST